MRGLDLNDPRLKSYLDSLAPKDRETLEKLYRATSSAQQKSVAAIEPEQETQKQQDTIGRQ